MEPPRSPLSRAAAVLAWRIACATAIVPAIVLSSIVTFYPIATIGTSVLLIGGVVTSIVAIVRTAQARVASRVLPLAAAGIGAWALFDAALLHAVWTYTTTSTGQLPWTSWLRPLMWPLAGIGIIGTLAFATVATPSSRRQRMSLMLLLAIWLPLHNWALFHPELGLVAIEELASNGLWIAAFFVYPIELLLIALSAASTILARRIANAGSHAASSLPTATARAPLTRRPRARWLAIPSLVLFLSSFPLGAAGAFLYAVADSSAGGGPAGGMSAFPMLAGGGMILVALVAFVVGGALYVVSGAEDED